MLTSRSLRFWWPVNGVKLKQLQVDTHFISAFCRPTLLLFIKKGCEALHRFLFLYVVHYWMQNTGVCSAEHELRPELLIASRKGVETCNCCSCRERQTACCGGKYWHGWSELRLFNYVPVRVWWVQHISWLSLLHNSRTGAAWMRPAQFLTLQLQRMSVRIRLSVSVV